MKVMMGGVMMLLGLWYNLMEKGMESMKWLKIMMIFNLLGMMILLIHPLNLLPLYLGMEFFSFTLYLWMLGWESTLSGQYYSMYYWMLNTLSTLTLLLFWYYSPLIQYLGLMEWDNNLDYEIIKGNSLFWISILFKLGLSPFLFIPFKIYPSLPRPLLFYFLWFPKFFYLSLLLKFYPYLSTPFFTYPFTMSFLYILSWMTLILSAIYGIQASTFNVVLTSSSFLLSTLMFLSILSTKSSTTIPIGNMWEEGESDMGYMYQALGMYYLMVYMLWSSLNNSSSSMEVSMMKSKMLGIFSLLNFMGFPPLGGFFFKILLLSPMMGKGDNLYNLMTMGLYLILTLFSSFFYLSFIFPLPLSSLSSSLSHLPGSVGGSEYNMMNKEDNKGNSMESMMYLILLFYSYLFPFFYPFFLGLSYSL